jgi:peptidoglycan/xylan/chitin deacetylase (PgdA/CDA1 family)
MTSQSEPGRYVCCLRDPNQIALTFDDGPNSDQSYTEQVLKILKDHDDTKATFFLIGEYVESRTEIVRKICAAGHAIGNHSYSHPNLESYTDPKQIQDQLEKCRNAIDRALHGIGRSGSLFRAPYGRMGGSVLEIAYRMGFKTIFWSADSKDYERDSGDRNKPMSAGDIVKTVSAAIDLKVRGEIVLLHDGCTAEEAVREETRKWRPNRDETVKATETLLRMYVGKRRFVALDSEVDIVERTLP